MLDIHIVVYEFSDIRVSTWWWPTQKTAETCSSLQQFENTVVLRRTFIHLISTSTDTVIKSWIIRLLWPCWWVSILHDAFRGVTNGGIVIYHLMHNLPLVSRVLLFIFLMSHWLHSAVQACPHNCCVSGLASSVCHKDIWKFSGKSEFPKNQPTNSRTLLTEWKWTSTSISKFLNQSAANGGCHKENCVVCSG
jgi:hypothetical protein